MYTIKSEIAIGLLAILSYYLILKLLKKLKIEVDENLLVYGISLAFFGASLRILEDANLLSRNFLTVTPGVWIISSLVFFPEYFLLKDLKKSTKLNLILSLIPISIVFYSVNRINIFSLITLIPLIPIFFIKDKTLRIVIFAFAIDSIVPVFSTNFFNYYEKHPTSKILLEINPFLFPIVKLFLGYILYLILNKKREEERLLLYFITGIVAAAGIRSFLRLLFLI